MVLQISNPTTEKNKKKRKEAGTKLFIDIRLCWIPFSSISISMACILFKTITLDKLLPLSYGAFTVPNNENRSSYVLMSGKIFSFLILANALTAYSGLSCKINAANYRLKIRVIKPEMLQLQEFEEKRCFQVLIQKTFIPIIHVHYKKSTHQCVTCWKKHIKRMCIFIVWYLMKQSLS